MYLQITTKCNMKCDHCCMSCGPGKGSHMTMTTFRNVLKMGEDMISLGGGEPTLHPHFWEILGMCLGFYDSTWMATNGSQTAISIALAKLAKKGVLSVALSLDDYHDPIDQKVIDAFTRDKPRHPFGGSDEDYREIRKVDRIQKVGRAITTGIWTDEDCCCDELVIDPKGDIYACGCKLECFGNVNGEYNIPDYYYDRDSKCTKANIEEPKKDIIKEAEALTVDSLGNLL